MAKGRKAPNGSTYVSQNGYHYTKVDGKFVLTHRLIVEKELGRPLYETERIRFKDGDRTNLDPDNLKVVVKGKTSLHTQRARLVARRDELQGQIDEIDRQIEIQNKEAQIQKLESAS
jgi:hypothetical protein